MSRERARIGGGIALLVVIGLGLLSCGPRHRSTEALDKEFEYYAKERYEQALRYMEASRFELAREQFAIVEQTSVTPELQALAREGYAKASAVIEAKR